MSGGGVNSHMLAVVIRWFQQPQQQGLSSRGNNSLSDDADTGSGSCGEKSHGLDYGPAAYLSLTFLT